MSRAKKLALSALLSALAAVVLLASALYPPMRIAFAAAAGLFGAVALIHCGPWWSLGAFAVVGALCLLLAPDKGAGVLYLLFFGWYPVAKSGIEQIPNLPLSWLVKLLTALAPIIGGYFLYYRLFVSTQVFAWYVYAVGTVLLLAAFAAYDIAFSALISFYLRRVAPHLKF